MDIKGFRIILNKEMVCTTMNFTYVDDLVSDGVETTQSQIAKATSCMDYLQE